MEYPKPCIKQSQIKHPIKIFLDSPSPAVSPSGTFVAITHFLVLVITMVAINYGDAYSVLPVTSVWCRNNNVEYSICHPHRVSIPVNQLSEKSAVLSDSRSWIRNEIALTAKHHEIVGWIYCLLKKPWLQLSTPPVSFMPNASLRISYSLFRLNCS